MDEENHLKIIVKMPESTSRNDAHGIPEPHEVSLTISMLGIGYPLEHTGTIMIPILQSPKWLETEDL
jgi:hypothetical protein